MLAPFSETAFGPRPAAQYCLPDLFRRRWHVHVRDAKFRQRVHDCIHSDAKRWGRATLASGANAQRMGTAGNFSEIGVEEGEVVDARHAVVHERTRQQLPGVAIMNDLLYLGLVMDDNRLHGAAYVMDGGVASSTFTVKRTSDHVSAGRHHLRACEAVRRSHLIAARCRVEREYHSLPCGTARPRVERAPYFFHHR